MKAQLAAMVVMIVGSLSAQAGTMDRSVAIQNFLKSVQGTYRNQLRGSVSTSMFNNGAEHGPLEGDCSEIRIGYGSPNYEMGDKAPVNVSVATGRDVIRIISGIGYYEDQVKVRELTDTVLKFDNVSDHTEHGWGWTHSKTTKTEITVVKNSDGTLKSIDLREGSYTGGFFDFSYPDDIAIDSSVHCER